MNFIRHPFIERDLIGIVDHIISVTDGDVAAASRRLDEIDELLQSIATNPTSGVRLDGKLEGWLVRHGGTGQRLTAVFKPSKDENCIYLAIVAFGGREWMRAAVERRAFGAEGNR